MTGIKSPTILPSPDFDNLLAVLRREVPARPTLFEFFHNERLYQRLAPCLKRRRKRHMPRSGKG